ncbi:MAG: hypothetical protein J3Q66DRAFT_364243 [Benniella sp.]|nr:MAG: hypothetical protein J3Q66DRAFT_364243 [Benniella sp.]
MVPPASPSSSSPPPPPPPRSPPNAVPTSTAFIPCSPSTKAVASHPHKSTAFHCCEPVCLPLPAFLPATKASTFLPLFPWHPPLAITSSGPPRPRTCISLAPSTTTSNFSAPGLLSSCMVPWPY